MSTENDSSTGNGYALARRVLAQPAPERRYADADDAWDSMGPAGLTEYHAVENLLVARTLAQALLDTICSCGKDAPFDGGKAGVCECCSTCTPSTGSAITLPRSTGAA